MGRAERRQKARFAGVRLPHQPNVADGFQLEGERPLFAGLALTRHARRPVRAGCEMDVSQAALSTPCHDDLLIIVRQVGEEMLALVHRGSEGNVDDEIRPALSVLERATSVAAPLRGEARPMSEWGKGVQTASGAQDDVASPPTVSSVRAASRYVLLTAETDDAISPVPCTDEDAGLVDETSVRHRAIPTGGIVRRSRTYIVQTLFWMDMRNVTVTVGGWKRRKTAVLRLNRRAALWIT